MNCVMFAIELQCPPRLTAGEIARSLALPLFVLAADAGQLAVPYPLRDRAKRRPRLDRLQLLGIAD